MTGQEFVDELRALGATDVHASQKQDLGYVTAVAVQCRREGDGRVIRSGFRLSPDASPEDAFSALLEWAKERVPANAR